MAWMGVWWIVGLAFLIAFVWMVTRMVSGPTPPSVDNSPEAIIKRRYAKGELNREQYEQQLSDVRK
jgi:uncharacterized membrane protein